ncbi:MAG: hypothetical protein R3B07_22870 [Polyangiaceae bacterium]
MTFGAGYRRHEESSGPDRLVANGADFVRAGIGYDFAPLSGVRLGLQYLWSPAASTISTVRTRTAAVWSLKTPCESVLPVQTGSVCVQGFAL